MNESQRRHLAVSLRCVGQLLEEADRLIVGTGEESPFGTRRNDFSRAQVSAVHAALDDVRRHLVRFAERFQLDIAGRIVDARHAIRVQLSTAAISVAEMRPRYLRGYGELDAQSAVDLDSACDELEEALGRAQLAEDRGGG